MAVLCANLDSLHPAEVRTATQLGIDTGRRPEDILHLPLDCLQRDQQGAAVLVYDNAKADRLGRRLPISEATAAVITAQQARVRQRFPDTPAGELKLLPSPRRNPDGRRAISIAMLGDRHREWADKLGPLRSRDGAEFGASRIVPYAYRHTYVISPALNVGRQAQYSCRWHNTPSQRSVQVQQNRSTTGTPA